MFFKHSSYLLVIHQQRNAVHQLDNRIIESTDLDAYRTSTDHQY